jgi:hypothetical protein
MATRKVPVTSVTPASKVTAVSKAQQARTRNLVMGIASVTPVGRVAKGAATAANVVSRSTKTGKAIKKTARTLAEPSKASVKVLPRKTAPKTDLSNRGTRPSASDRSDRAMDYEWNKLHGRMDARDEIYYTGMRGPKEGVMRDAGKKNLRKSAAVSREARKTVKINSQRNLKKK